MKNFWNKKRVLITGAAGFIGSNAIKLLAQQNAEITGLVSENTESAQLKKIFGSLLKEIKINKGNLLDYNDCRASIKKQEIILHFAAMDGSAKFKSEHCAEIFRVNSQMTFNVLEAARKESVERVLLMSSTEVYDPKISGIITEEKPVVQSIDNNVVGYGWSKRVNEIAGKFYHEQYGLKIAIARAGNVYGPGDYLEEEKARVIPMFVKKAIKKEPIVIYGNGLQKRSFLYVDDLINSLLLLTKEYAVADPVNISAHQQISIKQLASLVYKNASKGEGLGARAVAHPDQNHRLLGARLLDSRAIRQSSVRYRGKRRLGGAYRWFGRRSGADPVYAAARCTALRQDQGRGLKPTPNP